MLNLTRVQRQITVRAVPEATKAAGCHSATTAARLVWAPVIAKQQHRLPAAALRPTGAGGATRSGGALRELLALARAAAEQGNAPDCHRYTVLASDSANAEQRLVAAARIASILGLLEPGSGNILAAAEHLERWADLTDTLEAAARTGPASGADFVETLLALRRRAEAAAIAEREQRRARTTGDPALLASAARCLALIAPHETFEAEFRTAILAHRSHVSTFELARAQLLFGERLRRERRPRDARRHLTSALATFEQLACPPWVARATSELNATTLTRRRDPYATDALTPRELQVAEILADGATIAQAAAQLFLSNKTIETHLSHVYTKLHVRNRAQLVHALARLEGSLAPRPPDARE